MALTKKKSILAAGSFFVVMLLYILIPKYKIVEKLSDHQIDRSFSFGLPEGLYDRDITLELRTNIPFDTGLEIYYTTDGSMPDRTSNRYREPLVFTAQEGLKAVHLRAVVYQGEELAGGPYDGTWLLSTVPESLEDVLIVSIVSDEDGLFDPQRGILYPPKSYVTTDYEGGWDEVHAQNFAQKGAEWVRPARIKIFEGSGRLVIDQGCGLSISGNHGSIMHYPFSLNCKAGYSYDEDQNRYVYDFFGEREIRPKENFYYNSIAMKNSGNDYYWGDLRDDVKGTMLRNTVGLRMAEEIGLLASRQRIALVFLNGEFYNLVYLSANPNAKTISAKTGLKDDYIIFQKGGERQAFTYFKLKRLYHSFPGIEESRIFESWQTFERRVDMEELFRYYAFECIVGNGDWPHNNYELWRYIGNVQEGNSYSDGKYRHFVFDLDCMYDLQAWLEDPWVALFENPDGDNCLLVTLLQIDEYRCRFVNTVLDQLNSQTFSEAHILDIIEEENAKFSPWFTWIHGEEAEKGREENVALLKEKVLGRRAQVMAYLERYFQVRSPYFLQVLPAEHGILHVNSLYLENESYSGTYDAAYPVKIEYMDAEGDGYALAGWLINGEMTGVTKGTEEAAANTNPNTEGTELYIKKEMIQDGTVTVEPVLIRKKE